VYIKFCHDLFWGCRQSQQFLFPYSLFTPLHVSVSTRHLQVEYTQSFLEAIMPAPDPFLAYIYIVVLFLIMSCNILYLKLTHTVSPSEKKGREK
jgi:hypothetical protein